MQEYIIDHRYFDNVTPHQKAEMLKSFDVNENGDIVTSFSHKGYTCNNLPNEFSSDVMAISMFSGAGGWLIVLSCTKNLRFFCWDCCVSFN